MFTNIFPIKIEINVLWGSSRSLIIDFTRQLFSSSFCIFFNCSLLSEKRAVSVPEKKADNIIKPNKAITSNINIIKLRGSSKK
ncbi:hypothetical protein ES703_21719 [subsurface metagenome]